MSSKHSVFTKGGVATLIEKMAEKTGKNAVELAKEFVAEGVIPDTIPVGKDRAAAAKKKEIPKEAPKRYNSSSFFLFENNKASYEKRGEEYPGIDTMRARYQALTPVEHSALLQRLNKYNESVYEPYRKDHKDYDMPPAFKIKGSVTSEEAAEEAVALKKRNAANRVAEKTKKTAEKKDAESEDDSSDEEVKETEEQRKIREKAERAERKAARAAKREAKANNTAVESVAVA